MTEAIEPLSAKAKLALSRAQLLAAMGYEEATAFSDGKLSPAPPSFSQSRSTGYAIGARFGRTLLGRWWHRHPVRSVLQLGTPLLQSYAEKHPGRLIAYGAGTGALLWVLKPWKLLSVATVFALVFKGSDVAGLISDVISKSDKVSAGRHPPPLSHDDRETRLEGARSL